MKRLFLALLLSLSLSPAYAGSDTYTFVYEGATFTLTHQECANADIVTIVKDMKLPDGSKPRWYAGTASYLTIPGKEFKMCYVMNPENPSELYVMDEEGDGGRVDVPGSKPMGI